MEITKFYVAAKGIVLNEENKILMIQRVDSDDYGGMWEFPGGTMEYGELPEECLVREIKEEVNLDVEIVKYLYSWKWMKRDLQVAGFSYLCRCEDAKSIKLSNEHKNYKWVTLDHILDSELDGDIKNNLKKVMDKIL